MQLKLKVLLQVSFSYHCPFTALRFISAKTSATYNNKMKNLRVNCFFQSQCPLLAQSRLSRITAIEPKRAFIFVYVHLKPPIHVETFLCVTPPLVIHYSRFIQIYSTQLQRNLLCDFYYRINLLV